MSDGAAVGDAPDAGISHKDAIQYWSSVDSTVDGVLGGYPQISRVDLRGSLTFLGKLKRRASSGTAATRSGRSASDSASSNKSFERVVDCGAGIGRITAGCLSKVAAVIDIVEPVEKFAEEARRCLDGASTGTADDGEENNGGRGSKVGKVYQVGLESWTPDLEAYDVIWNQWCLGQLTDQELVSYLQRCKDGIRPGGWICVKENLNTAEDDEDLFDDVDSSVTRSDASFNRLFRQAGLKVVQHEVQKGFPRQLGLYPVKMYALRPA